MPANSVEESQSLELFERSLREFLSQHATNNPVALQIAHHFGLNESAGARRGKRLRPRLVMAAAAAYGCPLQQTLAACVAIELLHNYSLIHDDIEDGDRLRHGRKTVWAQFGLPHGINAGDAVGALAQLALWQLAETLDPQTAFAMSMDLASANLKMCQGQALDLALESATLGSIHGYLEMIEGKTAAVFGCAAAMGARCAHAPEPQVERCRSIGRFFGLGFQIRDDVLGIWGSTADTGKIAFGDLSRRKKTFPVVWALEHDPAEAGRTVAQVYGADGNLGEEAVKRLRLLLETCGSYDAARDAADNYFESASKLALGMRPLNDFVLQNRT